LTFTTNLFDGASIYAQAPDNCIP